jgi:hypothetical protein
MFVCWQVDRVDVGCGSADQDAPAGLGVFVELVDLKGCGRGAQATCERGVWGGLEQDGALVERVVHWQDDWPEVVAVRHSLDMVFVQEF